LETDRATGRIDKRLPPNGKVAPEASESLVGLARDIRQVLAPVEPKGDFRERLWQQLSGIMRQKAYGLIARGSPNRRRVLVLVAALGSLVPFLGVVCYLLRSRMLDKPQQAASQ
jgi:hypothetical protein